MLAVCVHTSAPTRACDSHHCIMVQEKSFVKVVL